MPAFMPALGEEKPEEELMGKVYYNYSMNRPRENYSIPLNKISLKYNYLF